ncbi:SDR family oxidoreductase [Vibrio makurazakiensis]|uniref:SDR family oxidoreductase n=1 Tax=Vibrio makurazakiensis TaxID=2910250 RepID=UPI003D0C5EC1
MDIKNSIILITSAGSVLGNTIANHFINLGATIVLCDDNPEGLESTYIQCYSRSKAVYRYPVTDYSNRTIQDLFDFIQDKFQTTPDVLVNNWTSSPMPSLVSAQSSKHFIDQFSSMASTLFSFGQASAHRMCKENKEGVIVNVISHDNFHDFSGLESANSMVEGFTHSWARELTPFKIRVGGVIPAIHNSEGKLDEYHWAQIQDELTRNTEYIVSNDYFSGRVVAAEV